MQTADKQNINKIRIKQRLESVRTRTRNLVLIKIQETQGKKRFLALVKHDIINLEFLTPHFVEPSFRKGPELIVFSCILPLFKCRLNAPSQNCSPSLVETRVLDVCYF